MEKRRFPRVSARSIPLEYRHRDAVFRATSVEDLSLGGACLMVDNVLPVGALTAVTVYDGNPGRALRLAAKVVAVSHRPKIMRICFEWMPDSARDRLQALLARLLTELSRAQSEPTIHVNDEVYRARDAMFDFRPIPLSSAEPVPVIPGATPASAPMPSVPTQAGAVSQQEMARMRIQLHGLLLQLGDANDELARRSKEIEQLRAELELWRSGKATGQPHNDSVHA